MGAFQVYLVLSICLPILFIGCRASQDFCIGLNQGITCSVPYKTLIGQREFYSFLGLRYAKPPVGLLRFLAPDKEFKWEPFKRLESSYAPICLQWDTHQDSFIGDEDCLFLNVYTPSSSLSIKSSLLPVLIFIHGGGGFTQGSGNFYEPHFLLDQDVIVITVQYRLGVLGFLSLENPDAAGNNGLLDIIAALEWVQDNIDHFGGNPQSVTLMGQGSGGTIVGLLIASPLTKKLFHKAILQSGSPLSDWAIQENPRMVALNLSVLVGCTEKDDDDILMKCLREKTPHALLNAQKKLMTHMYFPVLFAPIVDAKFACSPVLPSTPQQIFSKGHQNDVPMIIGETTNEGLTFYEALELAFDLHSPGGSFYRDCFVPDLLLNLFDNKAITQDVWQAVKEIYFRDVNFFEPSQVIPPFIEFLGDVTVSLSIDELVRAHSQIAPTYYYVFAYRKYSLFERPTIDQKLEMASDTKLRAYFQGAAFHGDDLSHLFIVRDSARFSPKTKKTDFQFTKSTICLFTAFVTLQNFSTLNSWDCRQPDAYIDALPLISRRPVQFRLTGMKESDWPQFTRETQHYLHLNTVFSIRKKYRHRERAVLRDVLRQAQQAENLLQEKEEAENAKHPYYIAVWVLVAFCAVLILGVFALLSVRVGASADYNIGT